MSDSVRHHRRQRTRLCGPWDSPGKNAGVGRRFLLQCRKVKSESEVAQSCPTLSDPMDCSLPGSSAGGIFQARVLAWGATAFSDHTHTHIYITQHKMSMTSCSLCSWLSGTISPVIWMQTDTTAWVLEQASWVKMQLHPFLGMCPRASSLLGSQSSQPGSGAKSTFY